MKKKIGLVCTVVLVLWMLLVAFDCVRLKKAEAQTKPLITLKIEDTEHRIAYHGLGYKMIYYVDMGEDVIIDGITYQEQLGYGAEFRVMNVLVWAWVE